MEVTVRTIKTKNGNWVECYEIDLHVRGKVYRGAIVLPVVYCSPLAPKEQRQRAEAIGALLVAQETMKERADDD